MAKLVEQSITTFFGGVSKQPASVRRDNQVEAADDAMMSVISGGFEKRPATQHIAKLTDLSLANDWSVHFIDRDDAEQFVVVLDDTEIFVYDAITGTKKTVNIGDSEHFFLVKQDGINNTAIIEVDGADFEEQQFFDSSETTFDWKWELSDASTVFKIEGSADGMSWNDLATGLTGATGTTSTTIGAVAANDHNYIRFTTTTGASTADDTISIRATFKDLSYLQGALPETITYTTVEDFTFINNRTIETRLGDALDGGGTITSTVQTFSDLPTATGSGNVHRVAGDANSSFDGYFVKDDASLSVWVEGVNPNSENHIDNSRMPHTLTPNDDGTWTFQAVDWLDRQIGDDDTVPVPSFIGQKISDVFFHRARLGFISEDDIYWGSSVDPFDLWPSKAITVLDTDPVDRQARTNRVTRLQWAIAFRKLLFLTGTNSQFEVSGSDASLTPTKAAVDLSTTYKSSDLARPTVMGDVLYFASKTPRSSVVLEYFFDEATLSNTAADITKHVVDYVPSDITAFAADPTSGAMSVLTSGEPNSIYQYRAFWDGNEKVQSAWSRYRLGADSTEAIVHGIEALSGFWVFVVERADAVYLEQMTIEQEAPDTDLGYAPLLDQRTLLTGSYDSGTNLTTWTTPYQHADDVTIIASGDFSDAGRVYNVSYPTNTTVTAVGDFSGGQVYAGKGYEMSVQLSEQFFRDGEGTAISTAQVMMKKMTFQFVDSGYFTVEVQLKDRDTRTFPMTGRILGDSANTVEETPIIAEDDFSVMIQAGTKNVEVFVKNDSPVPCVIVGALWLANVNELSRQE